MWIIFSLISALLAGLVVTLSKAGIRNIDSTVGFAVQSVLILFISWIVVVWQGNLSDVRRIEHRSWWFLALAGILTCLSSLFMFRGLKSGDAGRVSSLNHVALVFAVISAVIFLKERVNWQVITGVILMSVGALFIAFAREATK